MDKIVKIFSDYNTGGFYKNPFQKYIEEYSYIKEKPEKDILNWMSAYIDPVFRLYGDSLLLLGHYYIDGMVYKSIKNFFGKIGDSYELAVFSRNDKKSKIIVEAAVHFMTESVSILNYFDNKKAYIANPYSGCSMEEMARIENIIPVVDYLNNEYGEDNILPICYMNTSGRLKAVIGKQKGTICTSSNAIKIFNWAVSKNKKIFFIPDVNIGMNVSKDIGIDSKKIFYWPSGEKSRIFLSETIKSNKKLKRNLDNAQIILFSGYCSVHTYFTVEMVNYWKKMGYIVISHPECKPEVVSNSNYCGSTSFIWDHVYNDRSGSKKYAVATENNMVNNLKKEVISNKISVFNLSDTFRENSGTTHGVICETMAKNNPAYFVGLIDILGKNGNCETNLVLPGDIVDAQRSCIYRKSLSEQNGIVKYAKNALDNMIKITQSY